MAYGQKLGRGPYGQKTRTRLQSGANRVASGRHGLDLGRRRILRRGPASADDALQVGSGHFVAGRAPWPGANGTCRGAETGSGRFPVVELQDAAQALAALDLASLLSELTRFDEPVAQPLMVALLMVMLQELNDGLA